MPTNTLLQEKKGGLSKKGTKSWESFFIHLWLFASPNFMDKPLDPAQPQFPDL
jgi:hypothetical protein